MGKPDCRGVRCDDCPLREVESQHNVCVTMSFSAIDIIDIVETWGKEHQLVTNREKYKEVFGVGPCIGYDCPPVTCPKQLNGKKADISCDECRKKYWNAEYIPPKKEESNE